MGLDVCLYRCSKDGAEPLRIEKFSQLHPNHLFKIGYFRSSYNEHGFNSTMSCLGLPTLYDIFPCASQSDDYFIHPNWRRSKVLAEKALRKFRKFLESPVSRYRVTFVSGETNVSSRREALETFLKEVEMKNSKRFPAYSNMKGAFFLNKPLKVRGVVSGKDLIGSQGVYLIYDAEKDFYLWYLQALEIVKETIDWVLQQKNPEEYVLGWSR